MYAGPPPRAASPRALSGHGMMETVMTLTDLLPSTPDPDAVFDAFAGWSKRRGLALYPH